MLKVLSCTLVASCFVLTAQADGPRGHYGGGPYAGPSQSYGPYVGFSVSRNHIDFDTGGGFEEEADDTGYRLFGGFALNPYLRLEGGLIDFGELRSAPFSANADGATFGVEVAAPLGYDASVFLRGGALIWEADVTGPFFEVIEEGEDPYYGVGFRFWATPRFSVVGAFDRYELDNDDVDVASIGVSFGF